MSVITIRISPSLRRRLEEVVKKRGYKSLSEALNEAVERFVTEGGARWGSRNEVYEYFSRRKKSPRGLEDIHEEEDI